MFKRDFTIILVERLFRVFKKKGFSFKSVMDYYQEKNHKYTKDANIVVLRHDVDRAPGMALQMAKLEFVLNIKGTYYFRTVGSAFNTSIIDEIHQLGHEIGYHYEDLAVTNGDREAAYKRFQDQLKLMRKYAPVTTISMHGVPLSRWDPRDLWDTHDYRSEKILAEVYRDIDYSKFIYLTDTGRGWNRVSTSFRDIASVAHMPSFPGTEALIANILKQEVSGLVALTLHPERWANSWSEWIYQLFRQSAANTVKTVIKKVRTTHN